MKFNIITLMPKMIQDFFSDGVVGQALTKNIIQFNFVNPRQFTEDIHKTVDDRPFGGGDGMIMMAEPLKKSLESISEKERGRVIYLSPQGKKLDDKKIRELSKLKSITFICGRYGGIDQRFIQKYVHEELSIGDYVLSGGELATAVVIDAISRHIPDVLGSEKSAIEDSFFEGFLENPNFTRPRQWEGEIAPEVLFSGHHQKIQTWKIMVGKLVTLKKRPDLFWSHIKTEEIPGLQKFYMNLTESEKRALGLLELEFIR